jgi:hypothetical protein
LTKPIAPTPSWLRGSLLRFAVIFGLLIFPWPGINDIYGAYFRSFGNFVFNREDSPRLVSFDPHILVHDFSTLNTRLTLANRTTPDSKGNFPAKQIDLDTRSIGWIPTALTISLIAATPIPWGRRVGALLAGLVLVHALIIFTLETWIWSKSSSLALLDLTPFWQRVADDLRYTFLTQLGVSFTAPVLIWLLVCFRKRDAALIFGKNQRAAR